MINVDKIITLHYEPLSQRRKLLTAFLKKYDLKTLWITSEPTKKEIKKFYKYSEEKWKKKTDPIKISSRELSKSELSLLFKHYLALEKIVKQKHAVTLLLEDDVLFAEGFVDAFNSNLAATPTDWDYIFPGSGCGLRIHPSLVKEGQIAYLKDHPATKCTDSIIIKLDAAKKLLSTFNKWHLPADWEYNYQLKHHDMKVYWWEPPVFAQGSQCGVYDTTIKKG